MPDHHCMWKVAHGKGTTTDSRAVEKGLSGDFGTSKSAKSCVDMSLAQNQRTSILCRCAYRWALSVKEVSTFTWETDSCHWPSRADVMGS